MSAPSPLRIAYFGPENTNTHAAAKSLFGGETTYLPQISKAGVFHAVERDGADLGVVPIENSTEGVVRETIDCLIARDLMIQSEFEMRIEHCLMGRASTDLGAVSAIVSHPQPLAQCRVWLTENYPNVPCEAEASTSTAAHLASETPGTLAIATRLAAESFDLEVFEENIADRRDNTTRFLVIGKGEVEPSGNDKTTLVCKTPHEQGALLKLLTILDEEGINLTRIESRPLPERKWEYAFVIDVEGHEQKAPLKGAVQRLMERGYLYRSAGSYPRSTQQSSSISPPAATASSE